MKNFIDRSLLYVTLIFATGLGPAFAQSANDKPKIVIGIVVDQMRQDYLYKYQDRFSEAGFNRLIQGGYMMKNGHYDYIPTFTGPGHASVYTGTTPATHGIIGNNWYDRKLDKSVYCAGDSTVSNIGGSKSGGNISPRNLLTTTITDELRFATNKRSKVIGIAIKDRGAALPAGHLGDAYWYDGATGEFMTSSYYKDELPEWVKTFNSGKIPLKYLEQNWETLYPIESYVQSIADINEYEGVFSGKEFSDFPYNLKELMDTNGGLGLISSTPFGNSMTMDMAYAAIEGENLGLGADTDFLAISFSSPDYIGHRFGPSSIEVEDNYLRLDRELEKFFEYLDNRFGKGEYLIFLTSDHGVAEVVEHMHSEKVPAGRLNTRSISNEFKKFLNSMLGEGDWITNFSNDQIFLNKELVLDKGKSMYDIQNMLADFALSFEGVKEAYTAADMKRMTYGYGRTRLLQMGFNHKASGDVVLVLEPGWISSSATTGTTHGTGYNYDTHVPIIFYGWNIPQGQSSVKCAITDIAPTLSMLLNIRLPNGATGQPLLPLLNEIRNLESTTL